MQHPPENQEPLVARVAKGYRLFCAVMGVLAAVTIAVMILSTTTDTLSRYLFNYPLSGVFELNEALLVICVYMGLAWTQYKRGHIRVTVLLQRMTNRSLVAMNLLAWSVCLVFVFLVAWQSTIGAWESIRMWEFRWGSVQMPIWWIKSLIPLGCYMLGFQLIIDIWSEVERLRGRLPFEPMARVEG